MTPREPILVLRPPAAASADVCDRCGSSALFKVKGCVRCDACGYKADCCAW